MKQKMVTVFDSRDSWLSGRGLFLLLEAKDKKDLKVEIKRRLEILRRLQTLKVIESLSPRHF